MGLIDLTFNGKSIKDFHVFCTGAGASTSPSRKYDTVEIDGRNGTIYRDKGSFSNVVVEYKCVIYGDMKDFESLRAFINAQSGYKRLEDSERPYEYRMGVAQPIEPTIKAENAVSFSMMFDCMPQRFLKEGEKTFTINQSGVLMNNTEFDAKPLIRVYDNGFITINNKTLNIVDLSGYIDIDCETMDCYKGSANMNANVSGDFPILKSGVNQITATGSIDIIPRWWTL